jgi:signal transduction histidine kinase
MYSNPAMRLMMAGEPRDSGGALFALEAAGLGTWEIRPRSGEHVLSLRSRRLLSIGDDEPISIQRLLAALHPVDGERWKEAVAEVLDPESNGDCSLEFRTVGPSPRWLSASGRAFFQGRCAVRVAGTLEDITEQKRREQERDFHLGELGHDLRVPLSALSMGIELVQRDAPSKAEILSTMQHTAKAMDRLIERLVRSARAGKGEVRLRRERGPLADVVRQAVAETSLAYPGHPLQFECWDEAPGEWDRDRLLQVLRNLLSNAMEHGAPGEPVLVSLIDCDGEVLLSVANSGEPIPDPFREHLFDPTRRGTWSSDHLGLYIVREIVRAHGGCIELTSDESATVFHVWLPKTGGRS